MKVEILKENLKREISIIERVVGRNISLPILDTVLIEADNNFLVMTSTDLETAVKVWTLTKVIQKGKLAVPAKLLSSFVSSLPNDKIIIKSDGQGLYIECRNFKTSIQGQNPDDFPLIPTVDEEQNIKINSRLLHECFSQVVDVASLSQTRPEISGVYVSFHGNTAKIVATDSFRLAEKTILLEKAVKKDCHFIIPQKSVKEVIHILEEIEGDVVVSISPNQVLLQCSRKNEREDKVIIIARLIEGEYPSYQDIIPIKFKTNITVVRDEFLNQIKTTSLFSGKINEVKITARPDNGEVEVSSRSHGLGESSSIIKGKVQGEPMEISFNHKFLTDGLSRIKSSEVIFSISSQDGPSVFRPLGDGSYLYVVMPIKLS